VEREPVIESWYLSELIANVDAVNCCDVEAIRVVT
jgi:hypothetical protein